jgi:predicted nucleic acid-binding protein
VADRCGHGPLIQRDLQRAAAKGRALSQVDMMLAALGRQHKVSILTADRDFEALPDLRIENWTGVDWSSHKTP